MFTPNTHPRIPILRDNAPRFSSNRVHPRPRWKIGESTTYLITCSDSRNEEHAHPFILPSLESAMNHRNRSSNKGKTAGDIGTKRGPAILASRSFSNQPKTPWRASKSMRTRRGVSLCSLAPPRTDLNLAWNQPKYARRRRPPRGTPRHARDPLRERASSWPIVAKDRREHSSFLLSPFPRLVHVPFDARRSRLVLDRVGEGNAESGKGNWIKKFPRRRRTNYETIIAVPSAFSCST